ncbi:hypothetical protein EST62_00900 [Chlorobaculum sp. 24CR]|uniref:hypothetical protein n=1 Tax=Chlorobaculum sp. 24CR TaxID=2508878 RepID=UPI00100B206E|nr:hypothetical protein [Chlorobaculum sp. 24CR]RXK89129.1 hypothetical protein EST62_00900 [Chlorobaculum sp. 24CR]
MDISDLLSIGAVVAAVNSVFGYWAKSRIEGSIKHEYDKKLEEVKSEWKRTDILYSERLAAFKLIQKRLVSLQRYCNAHVSAEQGGEFSPRPDQLDANDNKSINSHWNEIETLLDENLIFLSETSRAVFERLCYQLSLGSNMELWLASDDPAPEVLASKSEGYMAVINRITESINALFKDLGFSSQT